MKNIRDLKLTDESLLLAKDYFMFSFYTQGMNYIDIPYLKVKNLHKDRLQYRRAKTGTNFTINLIPEAIQIIERYIDK
ncbi:MAG: site-specific integrase, partial [Bacteroidetes bacterium]